MLAKDNGVSLSTIGTKAAGENNAVEFATTHWSVVLTAQSESAIAREALEKLCRAYWRPLYAFVRRQNYSHEEAEDITQGFFAVFLERKDFERLRAERGRLRSYLLVSLKHFLADERRRAMAVKRGKGRPLIPLEDLFANAEETLEPSDRLTADRIYERGWALNLLDHVFSQLRDEYRSADKAALFDWLKQLLPDEPGAPLQAEIAAKLGMTENAVNQAFYRFRQRYQSLLREEIAQTVAMPKDVEDELRHLISVLRA
ncbi:MAG TPA: sigma-70 family RNA polymerase sigma factor [Candidatus Udaeobacter sp.]|nr:sigma-70 family RNA polymerase sigma factor [Candidatus Udaeobacter sp.]